MIPVPNLSLRAIVALAGGLIAVAALTWLVIDRNHWKSKAESYNAEAAAVYAATKTASGNQKLERRDTAQQILQLGTSLANVTNALNDQNQAVDRLHAQSAEQQKAAARAEQEAAREAKAASDVSAQLAASSRSSERQRAPCAPSPTLQEQWQ